MKIFYWAPWLGKVGSVKSVMNSANILEKYSKNHIKTRIIDAVGEWKEFYNDYRYIDLTKIKFFNFLPKKGFLNSRLSYIFIFLFCKINLNKIIVQIIFLINLFLNLKKFFDGVKTLIVLLKYFLS